MTRSVCLFLSRLALAAAVFSSTVSGCHLGRRLVRVGESFEMYVPEAWRTAPAAEDDGLGTRLWLFHGGYAAAVRVIIVPTTKLTPVAAAGLLLPELYRYRYRFDAADLPAEDVGQDVVLEYQDQSDDEMGMMLARRLSSTQDLIVIFIGVWQSRAAELAGQELADIASSARPVR